jgi:hypothetical protein
MEMRITVRVLELPNGGFVIAEELQGSDTVEWDATQAVSSIDEACGAIQRRLRDWHLECKQLRLRATEEADVIPMRRSWWGRKAIR